MNFKRKPIIVILVIACVALLYQQLFHQAKIISGNYLKPVSTFTGHNDEVWAVKFSPDDSLMVSGGIGENTKIWSRINGKLIHDLKHPYGTPSVDFSPDGSKVCTGSYDGKARIWDVKTGSLLTVLDGNESTLWSVAYSPSGHLIAAGGDDDKVSIWNAHSGRLLQEFKDADQNIWEVVFNPSGDLLLASGSDHLIRVYEVASGKLHKTLEGHSEVVLSLDFSPDGTLLVSGGDDGTVKIWDTTDWKLLHTLKGENHAIHSVVFIDNDKVLAGGTDKSLLGEFLEYHFGFKGIVQPIIATLWDVNNENILQIITQHDNDLNIGCDVSTDGKWLATPSADKTVKLWEILEN
jgi:WD40 repeat protein